MRGDPTRRSILESAAVSIPFVSGASDGGAGTDSRGRIDGQTALQSALTVESVSLVSTGTAPSTDGELRNVDGDVQVQTSGTVQSLGDIRTAGGTIATEPASEWSSTEYLDGDGSDDAADVEQLIEDAAAEGPTRIRWESGTISVTSTIAPSTDGTKVVIEGAGNATIDGSSMSSDILDCSDAPNLHGRHLRITGSAGTWEHSLISGPNSTWEHIVCDGGSGGIEAAAGCRFEDIEVTGQRDTENGYAQCFHAGGDGTDNWVLRDFEFGDSDRGVEIDDGPSHWVVENGAIHDIDNRNASSPGVPFALDCHVHSYGAEIENGTFRDVVVSESVRGLSISEHDSGLLKDITAENIRTENIGTGPAMLVEGDAELVSPTVVQPGRGAKSGITVRGGSVRISGGSVSGGVAWFGLLIREGARTSLDDVVVEGLSIAGESETNHGIEIGSAPETVRLSNCTVTEPNYNALRAEGSSLDGAGWGTTVSDCLLDGDLTIADSGNTKCLVRGGRIAGDITTPDGSVTQNIG